MKSALKLIACIVLCLAIGGVSGFATIDGLKSWYPSLIKPSFNPPNYLFGPVWSTLYALMGLGLFLILQSEKNEQRSLALKVFFLQLTLNFSWSFLFFTFHWLGISFIEIIAIWSCIILMVVSFWRCNKAAALIQIPYLLWVSFASVLNGSICFLNW
jgi:benzodiazapine receptor